MATKKKKQQKPQAILNRRASFDYALGDELTTGIMLSGREVRAARDGRVQLKGSFVTIRNPLSLVWKPDFNVKCVKAHPLKPKAGSY